MIGYVITPWGRMDIRECELVAGHIVFYTCGVADAPWERQPAVPLDLYGHDGSLVCSTMVAVAFADDVRIGNHVEIVVRYALPEMNRADV